MSITTRSQFRQVADVIRQRIAAGDYLAGSVLPKEDDLARDLGVTRPTVNNALKVLEAEGLVRAIRGRGTLVRELPPIVRNAQARYATSHRERGRGAFDVEVKALGREPRVEVRIERVTPPASVADVLGVAADEPSAVARVRHMGADDTPLQVATSYIPLDIAAGTAIEQEDTGPGGIISRLAELGHQQVKVTERVTVRPPTNEEAAYLQMTEDQRVYEIVHTGWTATGRAVEVTFHVMPTHQWTLEYGWDLT
ncbi:GntR family transcriptional regulator [Nonomuraea sp. NPDC026600]|uniref:GntR family transcriptional regulator n=1 Tax=Nonomuraea sp. NPDC026600 TaxID=3155363 RepID=UPI0033F4CF34